MQPLILSKKTNVLRGVNFDFEYENVGHISTNIAEGDEVTIKAFENAKINEFRGKVKKIKYYSSSLGEYVTSIILDTSGEFEADVKTINADSIIDIFNHSNDRENYIFNKYKSYLFEIHPDQWSETEDGEFIRTIEFPISVAFKFGCFSIYGLENSDELKTLTSVFDNNGMTIKYYERGVIIISKIKPDFTIKLRGYLAIPMVDSETIDKDLYTNISVHSFPVCSILMDNKNGVIALPLEGREYVLSAIDIANFGQPIPNFFIKSEEVDIENDQLVIYIELLEDKQDLYDATDSVIVIKLFTKETPTIEIPEEDKENSEESDPETDKTEPTDPELPKDENESNDENIEGNPEDGNENPKDPELPKDENESNDENMEETPGNEDITEDETNNDTSEGNENDENQNDNGESEETPDEGSSKEEELPSTDVPTDNSEVI